MRSEREEGTEAREGTERRESGEPGGGQGRRDEVGGSGVYPASAGRAPEDAVVRTPGEWGQGAGGEEGGRSEPPLSDEELRAGEVQKDEREGGRSR